MKNFEQPKSELICFEANDVIATSTCLDWDCVQDGCWGQQPASV